MHIDHLNIVGQNVSNEKLNFIFLNFINFALNKGVNCSMEPSNVEILQFRSSIFKIHHIKSFFFIQYTLIQLNLNLTHNFSYYLY